MISIWMIVGEAIGWLVLLLIAIIMAGILVAVVARVYLWIKIRKATTLPHLDMTEIQAIITANTRRVGTLHPVGNEHFNNGYRRGVYDTVRVIREQLGETNNG